jgi:hypothetical protein
VLTKDTVFEVEPAENWRHGVRQVLAYAVQVGLPPAVALFGTVAAERMLAFYEQLSGGQWATRPSVPVALWWWDERTWQPITGRGKCLDMARLLDAPQAKRAKTTAERQRAFRQRQADRIAPLEAELADVRSQLADALTEAERLAAQQCRHPAAAVDGGTCHACGNDVWLPIDSLSRPRKHRA